MNGEHFPRLPLTRCQQCLKEKPPTIQIVGWSGKVGSFDLAFCSIACAEKFNFT